LGPQAGACTVSDGTKGRAAARAAAADDEKEKGAGWGPIRSRACEIDALLYVALLDEVLHLPRSLSFSQREREREREKQERGTGGWCRRQAVAGKGEKAKAKAGAPPMHAPIQTAFKFGQIKRLEQAE
jgi:hypothetical protein